MPKNGSETDSKETRKRDRSTRRPPVFAVLLLAGFLLLVLSFITFRQIRSGEANRLRLLAGFAEQVEATVPELTQRFVKVVDEVQDTKRISENLDNVPNVSLVAGAYESGAEDKSFSLEARGPKVYLRYDTWVPATTEADDPESRPPEAAGNDDDPANREEDRSPSVSPAAGGRNRRGPNGEVLRQYLGLLDLAAVVRPIVIPGVFDLVVLARRAEGDDPGAVLFQQGRSELKLAEVTAAWEVRRPGMLETLREAWRKADTTTPSGGGTRVVETEIAGTDYRVFVQPVTLHLLDGEGNPISSVSDEWVACGVISWQRLLSSSFSTSPVILFLMVTLLPLMAICWPFLKMWLISRRQEFTRFDVAALVFSTFLGLALLTLLALDLAFVKEVDAVVDRQLHQVAAGLETNLKAEIGDAAGVLAGVSGDRGLRERFQCVPGLPCADPPDSLPPACVTETDSWRWVSCHLAGHSVGESYPFLHAIYWVDADGAQAYKIPFQGDSVLRNRVGDRGYFRCPQAPERAAAYEAAGATAYYEPEVPGGAAVCVESIRSKTTAGDLAVVSTRLGDGADGEPVVAALSTRFVSLTRPLLPAGFTFAILDRRGEVVFHSDTRRNANESFLRGTGGDRVLASMIAKDREGAIDLNYWGSRYRAWVHPGAAATGRGSTRSNGSRGPWSRSATGATCGRATSRSSTTS